MRVIELAKQWVESRGCFLAYTGEFETYYTTEIYLIPGMYGSLAGGLPHCKHNLGDFFIFTKK